MRDTAMNPKFIAKLLWNPMKFKTSALQPFSTFPLTVYSNSKAGKYVAEMIYLQNKKLHRVSHFLIPQGLRWQSFSLKIHYTRSNCGWYRSKDRWCGWAVAWLRHYSQTHSHTRQAWSKRVMPTVLTPTYPWNILEGPEIVENGRRSIFQCTRTVNK